MNLEKLLPSLIYILSYAATFLIAWFLGRYLKERGKIRCTLSELTIEFRKYIKEENDQSYHKKCDYEEADVGFYNIKLDFFSEKDVQIALRNPSVLFERKNKKKVITTIMPDPGDDIAKGLNLPSRTLVHYGWHGYVSNKISNDLENAMKSHKTFFVGYLPNGKKVKTLLLKESPLSFLSDYWKTSLEIKK